MVEKAKKKQDGPPSLEQDFRLIEAVDKALGAAPPHQKIRVLQFIGQRTSAEAEAASKQDRDRALALARGEDPEGSAPAEE